jgi:hypothetical protein
VTFDQWDAEPGDQITEFMERAVRENDFVIAICTPHFKVKSDGRGGGVGYEGNLMTAYAFTDRNKKKFIPVLRRGYWTEAAPTWLLGYFSIDLSAEPYAESQYQELLRTLHGAREKRPPMGHRPDFAAEKESQESPTHAPSTPFADSPTPQNHSSVTAGIFAHSDGDVGLTSQPEKKQGLNSGPRQAVPPSVYSNGKRKSVGWQLCCLGVVVCIMGLVYAGHSLFRNKPIENVIPSVSAEWTKEKVIQELDKIRDEGNKAASGGVSHEFRRASIAIVENGLKTLESPIFATTDREIIYRAVNLFLGLENLYYQMWKFKEACLANERGFGLLKNLYETDPLWRPNDNDGAKKPLPDKKEDVEDNGWGTPAMAVVRNRLGWAVLTHAKLDGRLDEHTQMQVKLALDYGVTAIEKVKASRVNKGQMLLEYALYYHFNGDLDRMEDLLKKAKSFAPKEGPGVAAAEQDKFFFTVYYWHLALLQAEMKKCEEALASIDRAKIHFQQFPDQEGVFGYLYLLIARASTSPAMLKRTLEQAREQLSSGDRCESCRYNLACVLAKMSETASENARQELIRTATEYLLSSLNRMTQASFEIEVRAIKDDPFLKSVLRQKDVIKALDSFQWSPKDGLIQTNPTFFWHSGIPLKCIRFTRLNGDDRRF